LKIGICIKQVPETTEVKIDPATNTLVREGVPSIVNPFDLYAVEEGLRIKEKFGGTVIAISMGPPQAAEALREVIAMGVDEAYLITDRAFAGSDTMATSFSLAAAVKKLGGFDLIFCGKQAIDGDTAQVGPGIAEWLDIPHIAFVRKINRIEDNRIEAEIIREEGSEQVSAPLPSLVTVVKEINEPRLPSLRGKIRAKNYELKKLTAADLELKETEVGLNGSPTWVIKIFTPPQKGTGIVFEGDPEQGVDGLLTKLKEHTLI
jgi:electron transfer flavoprotein beta subunit